MKRGAKWAALAGVALGTAAVIWFGAGPIFHAMARVGWVGLGYVVAWQLFVFILAGLCWRIVCPGASPWLLVWGRLVREGGMTCLPLSAVGGLAFGTRSIVLGGVPFARAAASCVADLLTEGIALVPFMLFGLVMLADRNPGSSLVLPLEIGAGILMAMGVVGFVLRRWLSHALRIATGWLMTHTNTTTPASLFSHALRTATGWLMKRWVKDAPQKAAALQAEVEGLFARTGRITAAIFAHLASWVAGAGNVWIGYHVLGAHPSILDAVAIEAIFSGALSVGQMVPGAVGVQELSYVGIGSLFGMPPHLSLALSLLRRARDIIIGAPALVSWQLLEARHLRKK